MTKYTLVNPALKDITYTGKENIEEVSKKMWLNMCDETKPVNEFAFSIKDDKNKLYHFHVKEKVEGINSRFSMKKLNIKKSMEKKFLQELNKEKLKEGGKKKKNKKVIADKKKDIKNKKKENNRKRKVKLYDSEDLINRDEDDDDDNNDSESDSDSDSDTKKRRKRYDESSSSSDSDSDYDIIYDEYYDYYPWLYTGLIKKNTPPRLSINGTILYPGFYLI